MDFLTLAKKRYSVRAYTKQKVEKEKLDAILEAAHVAPTGGNCQPQHLIVVQSDEGLRKIGKATNIYGAPLAIIVCSDTNKVWTRPFDGKKLTDIDASIITDHMMMEATYLGLGSVWVCYFKPDILKAEFKIPDNLEPVNILVLGYADTSREKALSADRHSVCVHRTAGHQGQRGGAAGSRFGRFGEAAEHYDRPEHGVPLPCPQLSSH